MIYACNIAYAHVCVRDSDGGRRREWNRKLFYFTKNICTLLVRPVESDEEVSPVFHFAGAMLCVPRMTSKWSPSLD